MKTKRKSLKYFYGILTKEAAEDLGKAISDLKNLQAKKSFQS